MIRLCGIYAIINLDTGMHYVGQSCNIIKRCMIHRASLRHENHYNTKLQRSWSHHGENKFYFIMLEFTKPDRNILEDRENFWIKECHNRCGELYNFSLASRSRLGVPLSDECKSKLSKIGRGRPKSEAHKLAISIANKGQVPWSKGKPSKFKGIPIPEERKVRISLTMKAYRASDNAHELMPDFVRRARERQNEAT